jgi:hypothetical protein
MTEDEQKIANEILNRLDPDRESPERIRDVAWLSALRWARSKTSRVYVLCVSDAGRPGPRASRQDCRL